MFADYRNRRIYLGNKKIKYRIVAETALNCNPKKMTETNFKHILWLLNYCQGTEYIIFSISIVWFIACRAKIHFHTL